MYSMSLQRWSLIKIPRKKKTAGNQNESCCSDAGMVGSYELVIFSPQLFRELQHVASAVAWR